MLVMGNQYKQLFENKVSFRECTVRSITKSYSGASQYTFDSNLSYTNTSDSNTLPAINTKIFLIKSYSGIFSSQLNIINNLF